MSLAQEQMEGLRRLRGLKARMNLQYHWAESACASSVNLHTIDASKETGRLATVASIDSASHNSAML